MVSGIRYHGVRVIDMGENKTKIRLCIIAITLLFLAPLGQGLLQTNDAHEMISPAFGGQRSGSIEVWQDEFLNTSKIDQILSNDITVDTTLGTVGIENTYPAWTDPTFSRMRPIVISNNGQETFSDYDLTLTIPYDTDMQVDFDDLRFTTITGAPLSYFKYNRVNGISCDLFVKIPSIPPGQTTVCMFYGNPSASDQSSFSSVFSWQERSHPDTMVSFKSATEGAWDPDVIFGTNRFLVTWEERLGPEDIDLPLPNYERTIPCVIHGRP